jgi:putative SOS response-associated peptidase YedK
VVTDRDGERDLVRMRWGLVPRWWSKPLKELRMATFNARAETVETKPVFRDAFKRSRCLIPMPGYYELQNTLTGSSRGISPPPMARRSSPQPLFLVGQFRPLLRPPNKKLAVPFIVSPSSVAFTLAGVL